ncbi:membrane protein [Mesobacillus campisalis]|uniref:Membrane protein n=1 Tax=Mesobacillus campisalis TaxID=1408103 RepID=A0A0M2SZ87_9BACI|nr:DUF1294 domain-containing protein [Mesobacillus campisalis]KKK38312.1 membrane protein [Mesobacillus campisalis]
MDILILLYLIMNLVGLLMMASDKQRARKGKYRISERQLWMVAILGGAAGMTAGMQMFRHKTKHVQFKWGLPVLAVIHVAAWLALL